MGEVIRPKRFERKRQFGSEADRPPHHCPKTPRWGQIEVKILRGVANPLMLIFSGKKKKKMVGLVRISFCPFCGEDLI